MEKNINQDLKWLEKFMRARLVCDTYKRIGELEGIDEKEAGAKYKKTIDALAKHSQKLFGKAYSQKEIEDFNKSISKDKKELWKKYRNMEKRHSDKEVSDDFGKFWSFEEFVLWYDKQPKECSYCNVTENDLACFFKLGYIQKSKKKSFNATLQIDRKNPNKGYFANNCVLACCVCNNAKSDMIETNIFREYLVEKGIRAFIAELQRKAKEDKNK